MKGNNALINLVLVGSMLFCMAFACGDDKERGGATTDEGGDRSAQTTTDTGVGAKFGTRDPRVCRDTKAPTSGAMTAALATKYLICSSEGVRSDNLYLIEGITTVEVGGSRPYNPKNDSVEDIDVTAPVYPLRFGSYKSYSCAAVYEENKGYNCSIYPYPNGTGVCRKTTFGDWSCTLDYQSVNRSEVENNMPPPTAANGGKKTAAAKTNGEESALPPPDFSEMEEYFDIVRYEYSNSDRKLNLVVKMTQKTNLCDWYINFYDADDVKVIPENYFPGETCQPELGEPTKAYADLPPESKWKFVKRIAITRKTR